MPLVGKFPERRNETLKDFLPRSTIPFNSTLYKLRRNDLRQPLLELLKLIRRNVFRYPLLNLLKRDNTLLNHLLYKGKKILNIFWACF